MGTTPSNTDKEDTREEIDDFQKKKKNDIIANNATSTTTSESPKNEPNWYQREEEVYIGHDRYYTNKFEEMISLKEDENDELTHWKLQKEYYEIPEIEDPKKLEEYTLKKDERERIQFIFDDEFSIFDSNCISVTKLKLSSEAEKIINIPTFLLHYYQEKTNLPIELHEEEEGEISIELEQEKRKKTEVLLILEEFVKKFDEHLVISRFYTDEFLKPMKEMVHTKRKENNQVLLKPQEYGQIFAGFEAITSLQKSFRISFNINKDEEDTDPMNICKAFAREILTVAPFFRMYNHYAHKLNKSYRLTREILRKRKFMKDFVTSKEILLKKRNREKHFNFYDLQLLPLEFVILLKKYCDQMSECITKKKNLTEPQADMNMALANIEQTFRVCNQRHSLFKTLSRIIKLCDEEIRPTKHNQVTKIFLEKEFGKKLETNPVRSTDQNVHGIDSGVFRGVNYTEIVSTEETTKKYFHVDLIAFNGFLFFLEKGRIKEEEEEQILRRNYISYNRPNVGIYKSLVSIDQSEEEKDHDKLLVIILVIKREQVEEEGKLVDKETVTKKHVLLQFRHYLEKQKVVNIILKSKEVKIEEIECQASR